MIRSGSTDMPVFHMRLHHTQTQHHWQSPLMGTCHYTITIYIVLYRSNQKGAAELLASMPSISVNDSSDNDHVLLVSYCLSENQR